VTGNCGTDDGSADIGNEASPMTVEAIQSPILKLRRAQWMPRPAPAPLAAPHARAAIQVTNFGGGRPMSGAILRAALALAAALPGLASATEGALGRPIAGTAIQPNAGIVPDTPMLIGNLTSIYFDVSIGGNARAPVGGEIKLNLGAKASFTSGTVMKVWDTGPGPWNFASSFSLPYLWNQVTADIEAPTAELYRRESEAGIFDLLFTPLTAGYHFSKTEHMSIGLGVWAPTGSYDKSKLANVGLNYWSFVPTVGYTKLWPEHGVEFSAVGSVQINTRNKDTDYQSAPLLTLDVLAAKNLGQGWRVGLVAAWVQQLADDKGPLADKLNGFRGYSVALGPIVTYSMKLGETRTLDATLRWTPSIASRNRMEGDAFTLTASVPF
jgi:hypothetical protein